LLENWTGNLNYWTGGKQGCKGLWGWCSGSEFKPFTANLSWGMNQPEVAKEKENCLHMRVSQNKSVNLLSDRECKYKYIFACKVKYIKIYLAYFICYLGKTHSSAFCATVSRRLQEECNLIVYPCF